jgi:hypothetical protein
MPAFGGFPPETISFLRELRTHQGPLGAVAGGGTVGLADLHLLAPALVRLAEGDPEGEVLAGAAVAGDDELIEGVGSEGRRGRASGVGVDGSR